MDLPILDSIYNYHDLFSFYLLFVILKLLAVDGNVLFEMDRTEIWLFFISETEAILTLNIWLIFNYKILIMIQIIVNNSLLIKNIIYEYFCSICFSFILHFIFYRVQLVFFRIYIIKLIKKLYLIYYLVIWLLSHKLKFAYTWFWVNIEYLYVKIFP